MELDRRQLIAGAMAMLGARSAFAQAPQPAPASPPGSQPVAPDPAAALPGTGSRYAPEVAGSDASDLPLSVHGLILSQSYAANPQLRLPNVARDAELIGGTFRRLGFEQIVEIRDAPTPDILSAAGSFLAGVDRGTIAVIYLAGHGLEIGGENLFLLSDGRSLISLQTLVQTLQDCAGVTVLFLDACRSNPNLPGTAPMQMVRAVAVGEPGAARVQLDSLPVEMFRAAGNGRTGHLRPFALPGSGVKIVFSTDPGNVALDGAMRSSRNGPFALALARRLRQRASLDDIIALTTGDVLAATGRRQSPWSQGSVDRPIYLARARIRRPVNPPTGSVLRGS